MEHLQKNGSSTNPMENGKCPFVHGASTSPDTSPLKWWPKRLNLDILHQHDQKTNPYSKDFDYREEVKSLEDKLEAEYVPFYFQKRDQLFRR